MAELLSPSIARQRQLLGFPLVDSDISATANINATKIGTGVVSTTEFNFLQNVTSDIQAQFDAKLTNVLTDGNIFVGNVSNVATSVAMSGDATMNNAGVLTVGAAFAQNTDNLSFFAATTSLQLLGIISDETGTGLLVFGTSPTLVTPALGTPSALVLTNATGLPPAGVTGVAAVQTDNLSVFAATTSLQLLGVISDESGSGLLVFNNSPTFITPVLGTPASGVATNLTGTSGITGLGTLTQNLVMGTNLITGIKSTQYVQNTITYNATLAFDFDSNEKNQVTLTGVLSTLTTSNRAAGKSIQIFIIGDSSDRVLTFNTSWKTNPSDATVTVLANTFGVLSLYCRGAAETDVFAVYAEFS